MQVLERLEASDFNEQVAVAFAVIIDKPDRRFSGPRHYHQHQPQQQLLQYISFPRVIEERQIEINFVKKYYNRKRADGEK